MEFPIAMKTSVAECEPDAADTGVGELTYSNGTVKLSNCVRS